MVKRTYPKEPDQGSDDSLRIAMLSLHSDPLGSLGTRDTGGMSVYIQELSRQLGKAGHRVDIYTCAEGRGSAREQALEENVRVVYLNAGRHGRIQKNVMYRHLPDICESLETFRTRNDLRYDLIHSNYWLSGLAGNWMMRRWQVPHATTYHTTGIVKRVRCSREREPARRLLAEKRIARECDRVFAPTTGEKEYLMRYYDVPEEKIGLVPCGVNLRHFRPIDKGWARKQLDLDKSAPVILYVGRFTPVKGMDRLLSAVAHLRHSPGLRLVIVGGDDKERNSLHELKRAVSCLGISGSVIFAGRAGRDELPSYYSAADVLVVPSYYESFGLVALESLACGTPVVATRVGAMDSIISRREAGTVVDNPSPCSLAQAVNTYVHLSHAGELSPALIRGSVAEHGWQGIASTVMKEYGNLIAAVRFRRKRQRLVS